jgi:hypothetical protein
MMIPASRRSSSFRTDVKSDWANVTLRSPSLEIGADSAVGTHSANSMTMAVSNAVLLVFLFTGMTSSSIRQAYTVAFK